eukprot:TRINITY_DN5450_c0_g2_i2.p1 TRINITY_DN5450_c0_g2~~TRINITY_DN5450_c0_g2_i2.p1  ORF type:complete len:1148 (+),score=306.07 TRINITY_DN5450_c0_g2_i2:28-3444(+)
MTAAGGEAMPAEQPLSPVGVGGPTSPLSDASAGPDSARGTGLTPKSGRRASVAKQATGGRRTSTFAVTPLSAEATKAQRTSPTGDPKTPLGKTQAPEGSGLKRSSKADNGKMVTKQATLGHMVLKKSGSTQNTPAVELTQVELDNFELMFSIYDADGSKTIDVHEIGLLMEGLGCVMEHDELMDLIGAVDTDGNNELEFDEFLTLMRRWKKHKGDADLMATGNRAQHIDKAVKSSLPSATILPGAAWKWKWDLAVMAALLYYCIVASPAVWVMSSWPDDRLRPLEFVATALFAIDMVIHSRMINETVRVQMVRTPNVDVTQYKIVMAYVNSWRFIPDFLSTVPFDLIFWMHSPSGREWKMCYHLRLLRMLTFRTLFNQGSGGHQISAGYIRFHFHQVPMLKMLFRTIVVVHWLTSLWLVVNYSSNETRGEVYSRYLPALYWVMYTLTSTGYGDIAVITDAQYLFACLMFCIGAVLNALLIGKLTGELMRPNVATAGHARLRTTLEVLQYLSIPDQLQEDVLSFLAHAFESDIRTHEELFESLPEKMECALKLHIKIQCISSVGLFQIAHPECKTEIARMLHTECYAPDQFVVVCGQPADVLYVLSHGFCDVLGASREGTKAHLVQMTIRKGDYFGEKELLVGDPLTPPRVDKDRKDETKGTDRRGSTTSAGTPPTERRIVRYDISIKTLTYTEFYQLHRSSWEKVLDNFPGYGEEVKEIREREMKSGGTQLHVQLQRKSSARSEPSQTAGATLANNVADPLTLNSTGRLSACESDIPMISRMWSHNRPGGTPSVTAYTLPHSTPKHPGIFSNRRISTREGGQLLPGRSMRSRRSHAGSIDETDEDHWRLRRLEVMVHSLGDRLEGAVKELVRAQRSNDKHLSQIPALVAGVNQLRSVLLGDAQPEVQREPPQRQDSQLSAVSQPCVLWHPGDSPSHGARGGPIGAGREEKAVDNQGRGGTLATSSDSVRSATVALYGPTGANPVGPHVMTPAALNTPPPHRPPPPPPPGPSRASDYVDASATGGRAPERVNGPASPPGSTGKELPAERPPQTEFSDLSRIADAAADAILVNAPPRRVGTAASLPPVAQSGWGGRGRADAAPVGTQAPASAAQPTASTPPSAFQRKPPQLRRQGRPLPG